MGWSTRQLAELAGTSLRTVRHYHDVGLLEEPERRANGYKSYGVAHLVRVMRIKRLSDLGFSLSQIAEMGEAEDYPEQGLRALDAELAGTIERLQRVRTELALVMRGAGPTELPPDIAMATLDTDMTEADRSLAVVMTRLMSSQAQDAYTEALRDLSNEPPDETFNNLPVDADEEVRRELAERMLLPARRVLTDHPELRDPEVVAPGGVRKTQQTMNAALEDLYNPAQLDVLRRVSQALVEDPPGNDA
ncbi:MerR family transcriptional regulator [Nocardiopsis sp. MG754419]|uniref:MerR family transcriptional regulator n=1 Tax=Nocardiopsis sp. MG754419 TaxID=2259865 RepID=UPI001BAA3CBC|nr:MerR family transcriptional regulator [Nocardiopsis sp. MG754419]MBR8743199.1 MerR family transcriptional regulator [Nocardiopsis sp. MG754419]